jgi:hypothetical protein
MRSYGRCMQAALANAGTGTGTGTGTGGGSISFDIYGLVRLPLVSSPVLSIVFVLMKPFV